MIEGIFMPKKDYSYLDDLVQFCSTNRQIEILTTVRKTSSIREASKQLNIDRSTVREALEAITRNGKKRGYLTSMREAGIVPDGFYAETSVQRRLNPETNELEVVSDWTKSKREKGTDPEAFKKFIEGLAIEISPAKPKKTTRKNFSEELASAIIFGDAHIGMLARAVETLSEDHDLEIATNDIRKAIDYLVENAPASKQGWFINVGDFVHVTNSGHTTFGGTKQDVSDNYYQIMRAAGVTVRYCIDRMLTKFEKVTVINARGNHDRDSAFALNFFLEAAYEKNPRVEILGNDSKFNFIEFGKCLVGVNHGDSINPNRLAGVMTRLKSEAWGRTTFKRWWTGHIHHKTALEHDSGVTIESFHTLAPIDAWHSASGYSSEQRVTMITLHKEFGEVNRTAPSLEMIRAMP